MKHFFVLITFCFFVTGCRFIQPTVPSQPLTETLVPTNTVEPTIPPTPTPSATPTVAVTETPAYVMPEVGKTPITFFDLFGSQEYAHARPVEKEILLNVILPNLEVGKGWSYRGGGGAYHLSLDLGSVKSIV